MNPTTLQQHFETQRTKEAAARARIEQDTCPSCNVGINLTCRYRGEPGCRIAPDIAKAGLREQGRQRMIRAGVPARYHDAILDRTWQGNEATRAVAMLVAKRAGLLILGGGVGCGKTFAAGLAHHHLAGCFVSAHDLARPMPDGENTAKVLSRWKQAPLLTVDDVGDEHSPGGFAAALLRELVREREHHAKPTILTTNLSPARLEERYGERLSSRVQGDDLGYRACLGADLRRAR